MHDFIDYLDSQGVEYYDWNVSSGDGGSMKLSTDTLLENCTKDIDTRDTSIILLHDSAEKPTTVEAHREYSGPAGYSDPADYGKYQADSSYRVGIPVRRECLLRF